jgi:hypothetical protein
MAKLTKKQTEKRITKLYSVYCDGISVPIMSVGDIYAAGEKALADGGDDEQIGLAMKAVAQAAAEGK